MKTKEKNMTTKTRTPKTAKPKTKKTETKTTKKRKPRTMTDPNHIDNALMSYSATRCTVDEALYAVSQLENDSDVRTVVLSIKKIRSALVSIRNARVTITENLKKNAWVKTMLAHLLTWEENLSSPMNLSCSIGN